MSRSKRYNKPESNRMVCVGYNRNIIIIMSSVDILLNSLETIKMLLAIISHISIYTLVLLFKDSLFHLS